MARVGDELFLLFHAFDHRTDSPAGKNGYQKEHYKHTEKGHAAGAYQKGKGRTQLAAAIHKDQQGAGAGFLRQIFIGFYIAGFPPAFQNILRIIPCVGGGNGRDMPRVDLEDFPVPVRSHHEIPGFKGRFGGDVQPVFRRLAAAALLHFRETAVIFREKGEQAVRLLADLVQVHDIYRADQRRNHEKQGTHRNQDEFPLQFFNHGFPPENSPAPASPGWKPRRPARPVFCADRRYIPRPH